MFTVYASGQTGRSTVWVKGKQNSGKINFDPESRVPFERMEGCPIHTNGIEDGFELEIENEFPFGILRPEKQDYPSRCSVAPGDFRWNEPKSRVPLPEIMLNFRFAL